MSASNLPPLPDTSREAFEAWYRPEYTNHIYFKDGAYDNFGTELAWKAWQASRKAALEQAIALCEFCGTGYTNIANSDIVTLQGKLTYESVAIAMNNCANEIKELLK